MSSTIRGNTSAAVLTSIQTDSNPGKGGSTTYVYRAFTQPQADALVSAFFTQGYETKTQTMPGGTFEVTVILNLDSQNNGGVEIPSPQWEVQYHAEQQSIYDADRPFVKKLTTATKAIIERCIKTASDQPFSEIVNDPVQIENGYVLLAHLRNGVESRQLFVPTIRRTVTVANNYLTDWALTNVGLLLTKSALISLYAPPLGIQRVMLESDTTPVVDPKTGLVFFYAYNEQGPNVTTVTNNRIQIAQEWVFNKWTVTDNGLFEIAA